MTDFSQKKVFVLGGSRAIGVAVVRRLFARDGAVVAFSYAGSVHAAQALAKQKGCRGNSLRCRKPRCGYCSGPGARAHPGLKRRFVHHGNPLELDLDAVDRMIDLNIRTPYHAALEAGRHMPDGGRVIVIGSPMAIVCHLPAAPLTP